MEHVTGGGGTWSAVVRDPARMNTRSKSGLGSPMNAAMLVIIQQKDVLLLRLADLSPETPSLPLLLDSLTPFFFLFQRLVEETRPTLDVTLLLHMRLLLIPASSLAQLSYW
jgi:hypothetical protein